VTHRAPPEWVKEGWPFTFVTDGVESAIEQAKAIAGDKSVAVASTTIVQQCLKAGLLEEIHIDLVPVLLGAGIRLFDHLDSPIELESTEVTESTGVTHLTFCVVK
jgi:dihydrofolate reductase